jgi:hypothetical protein
MPRRQSDNGLAKGAGEKAPLKVKGKFRCFPHPPFKETAPGGAAIGQAAIFARAHTIDDGVKTWLSDFSTRRRPKSRCLALRVLRPVSLPSTTAAPDRRRTPRALCPPRCLLGHPHRHLDQLDNEMIDTLICHLGFLAVLLTERLGLGDSFLQRRDVGFLQSLVFVRASARRKSGFLGVEVDKDASPAIVATLPRQASADGLLPRGFCRDVENPGRARGTLNQVSATGKSPYRCSFACTTGRLMRPSLPLWRPRGVRYDDP